MKCRPLLAPAIALFLISPPALGQEAVPDPAGTDASGPGVEDAPKDIVVEGELAKKQKKVCRSETQTGSIMSKRVCYTVAELEERERIAKYVKEELGKKQMRDRQVAEEMRSRQ